MAYNYHAFKTEFSRRGAIEWNNKELHTKALQRKLECFEKAVQLNPKNAVFINNRSVTLTKLERDEDAIFCHDEAIALKSNYKEAYKEKGVTLLWLNRYEESILCFDKAISLDSHFKEAYNEKATSLSRLGRYEEAISCYDQAIELDSNYKDTCKNKSTLLSRLRRVNGVHKLRRAVYGDADALRETESQHRTARQAIIHFKKAKVYGVLSAYIQKWCTERLHRLDIEYRIRCAIDHCHRAQVYQVLQGYIRRSQRLCELRSRIVRAIEHVHKAQVYTALQNYMRRQRRTIENAVDFVMDHILSARCPHCKELLSERQWQQESVLHCIDCGEHFCTWCFETALSEVDAEYCASRFAMEFEPKHDKEEGHKYCIRLHREVKMEEYLKTLSNSVKQIVIERIAGEAKEKDVRMTYR